MIYYIPWLFLIGASLMASIALFLWAYRSGQFSDQGRARFLPLTGSDVQQGMDRKIAFSWQPYALVVLLAAAGAVLVFTLILAFMNRQGG